MSGSPPSADDIDGNSHDLAADGGDGADLAADEADGAVDEGEESDDEVGRRRLVRILIALALGIPILVELRTVVNLAGSWLGGGDDETPTETSAPDAVGVGDELLPETEPVERLRSARVSAAEGDTWPFTVVVDVENDADRPYVLALGAVTTQDGATVEGGASTDRLDPGASATLATTWSLPEGATPRSVVVRAEFPGQGTPEVIERSITLRGVPVEG